MPKREMRQDRKELLHELEFVWEVDVAVWKAGRTPGRVSGDNKKKLRQQCKKLVEFKEKNGHSQQ